MAKMRPQMVIVWLTTLQKCITTWDPFRKFNLWSRPLTKCLECDGGGKKGVQLLVNDCICLSPFKMMSTVCVPLMF